MGLSDKRYLLRFARNGKGTYLTLERIRERMKKAARKRRPPPPGLLNLDEEAGWPEDGVEETLKWLEADSDDEPACLHPATPEVPPPPRRRHRAPAPSPESSLCSSDSSGSTSPTSSSCSSCSSGSGIAAAVMSYMKGRCYPTLRKRFVSLGLPR